MRIQKVSCIILDFDGPLLDGRIKHYACYCDIVKILGYVPLPIDEYWQYKRTKFSMLEQLKLIGAEHKYSSFKEAWLKNIEQKKYLALDELQPNIMEILADWKKENIKLILATMRHKTEHLYWQLKELGLDVLLDTVVVINPFDRDATNGKANSVEAVVDEKLLRNALWIGDTELDVKAAKSLNIPICAVSCGLRESNVLSDLNPDYIEENIEAFVEKYT